MRLIGLTGGIGSGKSTVSRELERLGAVVVDADATAREVLQPGEPAYAEVLAAFGDRVRAPDGSLDRSKLSRLIFTDPQARQRLNAITHPRIIARIFERVEDARRAGAEVVVLEVPLLLETGMQHMVDEVWVVAADPETQARRLERERHYNREEIERRIAAQMPLEEKLRHADRVIDTRGTLEETRRRVRELWREIQPASNSAG